MRTQSTPPATTDPPAAFISQRKKQPALALTGDGIQNVQPPIPLMLSTEAMHVNSLDESRMRMSFGAYAWIEKNAQRRKRRKSCRVKSKIHRRAPIAGISQDAVIKLLPEPLHGIYIDKAMAQDSNGLSASIFFGAVRRGVELGVFPEILGTSPEDTFELTAERSKLFMRPTADRRRQQELPVLPKATALSMAALAFERATEDLDEESSHLESSALNSPRSNQGSIADLRAWDQQHDDLSMKNVPMEAQSPSEAQLLPGRKFPPQQQDDVAISTRKEATTLLPEPSIVQPEHTSPRVLSRDAMALASAAMEEPPPAPAKYPHLEAGGISSDSSSDELEWGEQQESLVAVESKKVGGSHFDEHSKKRVKAMRLKAAARRAKAELHAAATAAKTTAGREEESERLKFLGLATDHDKHNVQQPLIARQILTQASIASPTTARGSGFVIRHAARILDSAITIFKDGCWQSCLIMCSTIVMSLLDATTCVVPALELRAACWMKLRVWNQVVADCTLALQTRGASGASLSRAYARRAHARLQLSYVSSVRDQAGHDSVQLANSALVDAKLGQKCEEQTSSSGNVTSSRGVAGIFEEDPWLILVGVFRLLGKFRVAHTELERANQAHPHDWRVWWCLGDLLAEESGLTANAFYVPALSRPGLVSVLYEKAAACRILSTGTFGSTDAMTLHKTTNVISDAVAMAANDDMMQHLPFNLILRYGDVLLFRMYQSAASVTANGELNPNNDVAFQRRCDEVIKHAIRVLAIIRGVQEQSSPIVSAHVLYLTAASILQARRCKLQL